MGIFDSFKEKRKARLEAQFREHLMQRGRITDGMIIDTEVMESGQTIAYYSYTVHGAEFESSEILNEEQLKDQIKYAPGANVGVKYHPNRHGSSILI